MNFWSVIIVNSYNEKIEAESNRPYELWRMLREKDHSQVVRTTNQKSPETNTSGQGADVSAKPSLQEWSRNNPGRSINDYYSKFGK